MNSVREGLVLGKFSDKFPDYCFYQSLQRSLKFLSLWDFRLGSDFLVSLISFIVWSNNQVSGLIPSTPKLFSEDKITHAAEVNQRRWLEESGEWLENVDKTTLVLARGKPVLQKNQSGHIQGLCLIICSAPDNSITWTYKTTAQCYQGTNLEGGFPSLSKTALNLV